MSSEATRRFLADLEARKTAPDKVVPQYHAPRPRREWKALLGQVLEYGDTGFRIVLQKDPKKAKAPYRLEDPEGRVLGEGTNLPSMKQAAEDQAKMRDEFAAVDPASFNSLPKMG